MKAMKTSNWLLVMIGVLVISLLSCEEGVPGMEGPQGAPGIPGKDGAVILSGQGTPAASIGGEGDMYLDLGSARLYGPKSTDGWGNPLNLRGATGAKGDKGNPGDDGADGITGTTGPRGPKGDKGDPGDDGADGTNGSDGANGATGPRGPKGDKGDPGDDGVDGANGTNGNRILSGTGIPAGTLGNVGDYYLNRENGDLYGPKASAGGWGSNPINLVGTANVVGTGWIDVVWDTDQGWMKSFEHTVPNPVLNAVGVSSIKWLNDNGGVVLMYLRVTQDSPVAGMTDWQWQIPSMLNSYWDVDVKWSLLSASPNLVAVTATEGQSNSAIDIDNAQFRYVVIPPGETISLQGRGVPVRNLSYDQALQLLERN